MNERVSNEDLAQVRTLIPAECVGLLRFVDLMVAELHERRRADKAFVALADLALAYFKARETFEVSGTNERAQTEAALRTAIGAPP